MIDHWCRRVMNEEVNKKIKKMKPRELDVLEVSGREWQDFGFKNYKNVLFPDFDICRQITDEQYDLIIAEQVFEHIEDPVAAADNILNMLRPGGMLLITTPFLIKYHPSPLDLWRWTKEGLKLFLEKRGYSDVRTFSWGNKECVIENLDDWPYYDKKKHSLSNDEDFPIVIWGFAYKR